MIKYKKKIFTLKLMVSGPMNQLLKQNKNLTSIWEDVKNDFFFDFFLTYNNRNALKWTISNRVTRKITLEKNGFNQKNI